MLPSGIATFYFFKVPFAERKVDGQRFGEGEPNHICADIMRKTGAHIEISQGKDQSITFLVTGITTEVSEARKRILQRFQTQANKQLSIPKEHHRWILGKKGARLRELEKTTATNISVPSMEDPSDIITISGTKECIERAEHEIRVLSDEQSKKASERLTIPKHFHPFIVGAFSSNVNALMEETKTKINVPPPSVMKDEIVIAGEKDGVAAAKAKIEEIYKRMEKKTETVSVEVPKCQHKYVIGPKGATIAEILQTTGVSVEMPQSDSATGTITLRGPQDKLGLALGVVYGKANSVRSSDVDAPSWLHKYIIGKGGAKIREITANLPKVHVEFSERADKIKIEGPPEEVEKAQEQLEEIANNLIANMTFAEMHVDPKLFKHIIGKSGANINKLKDDFDVVINIDENGFVRIEGSRDNVVRTQSELEQHVAKLENEKERDVIIEQRHYRSIIGAKGENIKEIRDRFNQVQIFFPSSGESEIVKVRGPKEDVDKCVRHLEKLVKELNENSFQKELTIFKQFHKFIIGKGGANIRKIREETNTKIDLPAEGDKNDRIKITGKRENVEDACEKIRQIQQELESIVTEEITIPPKFYNSLIGAKGKLIRSVSEDCGGVTIKFPSADSKSDKITISGPQEDVDKAKQQLLDLANERQQASFTAEVRAKAQHHKFLIGRSGANIKKIRDSTGARIVFPSNTDEDREVITIIGKKEAVEEAKDALMAMIKDIDNIVEDEMQVEPRHHKHFVARRGEVLHRITDECGGVMISFPRSGVASDKVVLKGPRECIEAAKQRIREIITDLESMVTIECIIPQKHHRNVMGAKGHKVQRIVADCDVQIKFPDKNYQEEYTNYEQVNGDVATQQEPVQYCDVIRITGKDANCQAAKAALLDLVPVTISVDVPFNLHRSIIGQKGRDVKDLMDRFDVHIVLSAQNAPEDVIKITGAKSNVEGAREALLERVAELEAEISRTHTLELEVNPEFHPKIIGKRGAVITKIRKDREVQINFPKKGDPNEHIITITGYEENVQGAKDDIMKIVNELMELVREEVLIDARVHSRLIGFRGRNIKKIMEDYCVDIKFPRSDEPDPNLVVISGQEENVSDARDHLLNLEEEYLQDVEELQIREKTHTLNVHLEAVSSTSPSNGFVVPGGPWEQRGSGGHTAPAPDTASVTDFPAFGRGGPGSGDQQSAAAPIAGAWGARR
ncbi:unnamed protein product [Acanthoscelides obtectus]|uniref:K Homology domain-containing protein n=1 Tax=Acanthoscelides obtectus TaxID=200917 RepID=A0A9P0NSY8_ACAOB|nr:unnamed protein product [Acanthoscelides obtectus]CAK1621238.1 Vigilin [Acanthoscelides obtectus]